jgi:hypothetical protein
MYYFLVLPAGAIAGWASHPLESAAFARRTPAPENDIEGELPLQGKDIRSGVDVWWVAGFADMAA